jgi:hypothetical protein
LRFRNISPGANRVSQFEVVQGKADEGLPVQELASIRDAWLALTLDFQPVELQTEVLA